METTLAWGILGTGRIAGIFARGVQGSTTGRLSAVGSRTQDAADAFGTEFGIPHRHGSYEALLADPDVQAVYIATPHPLHAEWAIKAAEAGKHILCEKPLALNYPQAMAVVEAAQRHDVFLMEAFMYRCHPQTAKLVELIRAGTIGAVRLIQAAFSFDAGFNPSSRLFRADLGGGGILDVGCYCTSMARLIAGAATGRDVAEPVELHAVGRIGETGVDEYTIADLAFPGGILAQLVTGVRLAADNAVRIFGSAGSILVPDPWVPAPDGGTTRIVVRRAGEEPQDSVIETDKGLYAIEADTFAAHVATRQAAPPAMTWDDSLGNMKTLDQWRAAIGLEYPMEKPEANTRAVSGRPLARRADHTMRYGSLDGVDKPVSRLVLGVDNQTWMPHAAVMFDDFFERGGTCFDTAYIYGNGACERVLGQWITNRGVREQVVILDKGAHTPYCTPEHMTRQLHESLERLQTDYVDLYMMHRDNPDIPVGEFVDVLNEHLRAGRIRAFGVSNWTIPRIEEALAYAQAHHLAGPVAVSNNLSLARMIEPPWAGCLSVSDPQSRAWFERTQMPLMPWSSQARGFFTGRARPDDRSDPELARCWYSPDNFARLERAQDLARQLGVLPITVALAYVLCQPFPTFPLIGPRSLAETRTSFQALDVELSPEQVRWLDTGA